MQGIAAEGRRTSTARSGVADIRTGAPVPDTGYFRMGSNTKTFAAVIVLQLVAEGRLSLDDTVERWLPGVVAGNGNDGRRVTVVVLAITSRLAGDEEALAIYHRADRAVAEVLC